MRHVLLVSKPVTPPWSDSSKNLVRDLAQGIEHYHLHLMGSSHCPFEKPNVTCEPVYTHAGRYAPSPWQNARALFRVAKPDRTIAIYHFFFAPNPITSGVLRPLMRLKRQKSVHTVCSAPHDLERARRMLFADRVVAVSDHTADALTRAGIGGVRRIYPCIDPDRLRFHGPNELARELGVEGRPVVLYAGDIELPGVPGLMIELLAGLREETPNALLLVAARDKTRETSAAREAVLDAARVEGLGETLRLLAEVARMDQLLALTTVAILPVPTLYRKMDIPLVLLEAMAQEIPIVVSNLPPLQELAREDCGIIVPVGDGRALARAVVKLLADRDRRQYMGQRGRQRVQAEFSIAHAARAYENLYEEILNVPGQG